MKISYPNLIIFFSTILSIVVGTYLWKHINFPYINHQEIIGSYSKSKHSELNDTIRYLVYVCFPVFIFCLSIFLLKKHECNSLKDIFLSKKIINSG